MSYIKCKTYDDMYRQHNGTDITYYHDSDTSSTSHTYCALGIREGDYVELWFHINDISNELFVGIPSDNNQVVLDNSSIDNAITKAFDIWMKRYYQDGPTE